MTTRAAVNILGTTGELIDLVTLGVKTITTEHPETGLYLVHGTLGMVPPPEGWGYVVNSVDSNSKVSVSYEDTVLKVSVTVDDVPTNLAHSITLHVVVEKEVNELLPEESGDILVVETDYPSLIASTRYQHEVKGCVWLDQYIIDTSREGQNKVQRESAAVERGLREDNTSWKLYDGADGKVKFRQTTNTEILDISAVVYYYVKACFNREDVLLTAYNNGTLTDSMILEGWPT